MRYLKIGNWSSAIHDWTLSKFEISAPQYRRSTIIVPGRDGEIDLSDALTGAVQYANRKITVRLENSCGTRLQREHWIYHLVNAFDGTEQEIEMPDDESRYMRGRLRVATQYNDNAHAAVQITADVEPWKYSRRQTSRYFETADAGENALTVHNSGRKTVIPEFQVILIFPGDSLRIGSHEITDTGYFQFPDITFSPGDNALTVTGRASFFVRFTEGVL